MKTEKQQYNDYVKLMKAIIKIGKNNGRRIFARLYDGDNVVYLSDGCCVFGIPYNVYEENYKTCKCPTIDECKECKVDLKKIILDVVNDKEATECTMTTMCFVMRDGAVAKIYKTGKTYGTENKTEFGAVNTIFTDLLDLLPYAIKGYNPKTVRKIYPIAFYSDVLDTGYAICPINFDVVNTLEILGFEQKK